MNLLLSAEPLHALRQAVEALKEREFDLVLMDMHMPIMDGVTATRLIREMHSEHPGRRRVPIIGLSAYTGGQVT